MIAHSSLYKQLLENMAEAVWMWDKDEKTLYANPKFCKLVWYSLDEIIGQESLVFWDEESKKEVRKNNKLKRKKGKSSSYLGNLLTKSWEKIPVELHWTPIPGGGTIGIMTDLRAIKEKEAQEKILLHAIEKSTDAMMIVWLDEKIIFWNKGAQIIFWHKQSDINGKKISSLFYKKDLAYLLQTDDIVNKYETKAKHKNKHDLHISVTQSPVYDPSGEKVILYLLVCRDITNYRKVEENISLKEKKIKAAYKEIGVMRRQSDYIEELLDMNEKYYLDNKKLADYIVTSIIMLTQVDACELLTYNSSDDSMNIISHFWFSDDWSGAKVLKFSWSLAQKAYETGEPIKIIDISSDPLYQRPALVRKHSMTSLLLIPLIAKGKFIGMLGLYTKADKKLEIFENEFIEKYAKIISLVLSEN